MTAIVATTSDEYELPVFVGKTCTEVEHQLGLPQKSVSKAISMISRNEISNLHGFRFFRVQI